MTTIKSIIRRIARGVRTVAAIGVAGVCLATVTLQAQQKFITYTFTNTAFVTPYTQTNGVSAYTAGGTVTLTNLQATWAPATAVPMEIRGWQNVPVSFELTSYAITNSTSPTGVQLSLSRDAVDWVSNAVSISGSQLGTNVTELTIPLINGTNAFTGFAWARWDYATNGANTNTIIRKLTATVFR